MDSKACVWREHACLSHVDPEAFHQSCLRAERTPFFSVLYRPPERGDDGQPCLPQRDRRVLPGSVLYLATLSKQYPDIIPGTFKTLSFK